VSERSSLIAWRSRWTEVNRETSREAAAMPATERLRTLARLRAFAASGHVSAWPDDEADVWARFARLRTLYRARHAGR
jgi:hypothetical protein